MSSIQHPKGRGAGSNPHNRFERQATVPLEAIEVEWGEGEEEGLPRRRRTTVFLDKSRSVLARNDSPDVGFEYSINPYRGCEHGCIYCYARPSHEYLGFSAGLDFETKIMAKLDAPELLARELGRAKWQPQMVALSGNTDCYQPIERTLGITRRLLETFLRFRNPVGIITKNALIMRDLDLLRELAARRLVGVTVSVTTLDPEIARKMEPRAAAPARRLDAIEALAQAGVPVGVNVAPIVPGLTDEEIPAILEAAHARGARRAGFTICRLPGAVEGLFAEWVRREFPLRADKILGRLRDVHGGRMHTSRFGERMRGAGEVAKAITQLYALSCTRLGFSEEWAELDTSSFRRDPPDGRAREIQGELFGAPARGDDS
jgi:DNA repair photolyase